MLGEASIGNAAAAAAGKLPEKEAFHPSSSCTRKHMPSTHALLLRPTYLQSNHCLVEACKEVNRRAIPPGNASIKGFKNLTQHPGLVHTRNADAL
jgi:hypothetical protein